MDVLRLPPNPGANVSRRYLEDVRRWWGLTDGLTHSADERRTVATVAGDSFAGLGIAYAAATGAHTREVATVADAVTAADEDRAVLVVAEPGRLRADTLEALNERAVDRAIDLGFVTAPSVESCELALAKSARRLAVPTERLARGHIDAGGARATLDTGTQQATVVERDLVRADLHTLLVAAHGSADHVHLAASVLCGVVGEAETLADGTDAHGCDRATGRCRRTVAGSPDAAVAVGDVRAELLVMLACASFCTTGTPYPSDNSVLLAAAAGYPAAFVGLTRLSHVVGTPRFPEVVDALIRRGLPLGTVVRVVNGHLLRLRQRPVAALLGDPALTFAGGGASGLQLLGSVAWPDDTPRVVAVEPRRWVFNEPGRSHVLSAEETDPGQVGDATAAVLRAGEWFRWTLARMRDSEAFERAATSVGRTHGLDAVTPLIAAAASSRRAVVEAAWHGVAGAERDCVHTGVLSSDLPRLEQACRAALVTWHEAMFALAATLLQERADGRTVGEQMVVLMRRFRLPAGVRDVGPCPVSGSRLVAECLDGSSVGLGDRTTVECATCGLHGNHGAMELCVVVHGDRRPGSVVTVELRVRRPAPFDAAPVRVAAEVRHRIAVDSTRSHREVLDAGTSSVTFPVAIDDDLVPDMWSVRAVAVGDGEIAYARQIFAVLPRHAEVLATSAHPGTRG